MVTWRFARAFMKILVPGAASESSLAMSAAAAAAAAAREGHCVCVCVCVCSGQEMGVSRRSC
jgi:hypothetical protein